MLAQRSCWFFGPPTARNCAVARKAQRPEPTPADKIVCAVHAPLDAGWVEGAFARIEELTYGGDAAALAAAVAELSVERALAVQGG